MAKLTMNALVSEVRGKVGTAVFSKNKGGAVVRNRVKPINRGNNFQRTIRTIMAQYSGQWRELTQEQRDSWNRLADH